jgi:UDP:flavonoid glycosyltransferase YjiC (YdhE family)
MIIPHGRDQGDNAIRVVARGAGLMLPASAPVEELQQTIGRLLEEPSFRSDSRRLGEAIAEEVRDSTLVEQIEGLAAA